MGENLFVGIAKGLRTWLESQHLLPLVTDVILMLLAVVGVLAFLFLNALFLIYYDRKFGAWVQARLGPNRVGPRGIFQTVADTLKLFAKEIFVPSNVDRWPYLLAPVLIFTIPVMLFLVIPFGKGMVPYDLNLGILYIVAVTSLETITLWMAGWSSNSKYSLLGAMRSVAQMLSYEMPVILAMISVVMMVGSMKLSDIVAAQQKVWFIFLQPVGFLIYFIAVNAEIKRTPFDLVEGESEIISGPYTEYSGMNFALFFLAEYTNFMIAAMMVTTLFLGGWNAPFGWTFIPSWLWFFLKMYLVITLFMWTRWTFLRIRIDQMLNFAWKFLLPLSLVNIFITGFGLYLYRMIRW
ncbi:NADH-quinone oxidoreductase subunit NuoH [Carboxydothermus pertinax]|uniref:NADH-quinone oxidoreductase subunit H n=1 Tax=Carboxydothermus pertinax TaxID=870242 RepID=A0A1L8CXR8_9THEO|nr:NADH-quinone oxidoreductase subunit NuoH [Carboxydothermus pertinax]GAV23664.1 NADH-quinone oxidoreductase subunit H [Carboxydothermus pertinax]